MSTCKIDVSSWDPKQYDFQFFWPLTEQIPLELNFQPCKDYEAELFLKRNAAGWTTVLGGTGITLMSTGSTVAWSQRIGEWEIPSETKQPSKLQKFLMKYFLGWKWMGK